MQAESEVPLRQSCWRGELACLLLLLVVAAVFQPGLHGPFLFDDFPNFLQNRAFADYLSGAIGLDRVLALAHAGPLGRPLAVASLALQMRAAGPVPFTFKLFNLIVHLCNACLVYVLARQLLPEDRAPRARAAALLAALVWALHPLALSPVLYVVQRMTSLAALGTLLALNGAVLAHRRLRDGRPAALWLWGLVPAAALLGLLAKESGALVFPYLGVLAVTVLAAQPLPDAARPSWRRFLLVFCALPVLAALAGLAWKWPAIVGGFGDRDFTLSQRLLSEARIFWLYLRLWCAPDLTLLGLYHDDVPLSTGLLEPWTTLPAVIGCVLLAAAVVLLRRRAPWFAFAGGMLLVSQLLEGTILPLELMHEHRMYLGTVGPTLALAALLLQVRPAEGARWGWSWAVPVVFVLLLAATSWQRALDWGNPLRMAALEARHHPASVRAQYDLATVYGSLAEQSAGADRARLFAAAEDAVRRAGRLAPQDSKPLTGLLLICGESACEFPADTWSRLQVVLSHGPRADLMIADVRSLSQCLRDHVCRLPPAQVQRCFDALLANPRLPAPGRLALEEERQVLLEVLARGDSQ